MTKLRVLDLFSGIGGFSLGLERTGGFETVAFCEIEDYPRRVLAKHWPNVPCYDDVRTLTAARLAADGIAVDVICGGFPCQDISVAGKGAGIGGERSGLWSEYARLVGELRPRFVIIENVSALLGRGLADVLRNLAEIGFDAEWHCVPASAVGAPHRRDRVWIVAHSNCGGWTSGNWDVSAARYWNTAATGGCYGEMANPYGWHGKDGPRVQPSLHRPQARGEKRSGGSGRGWERGQWNSEPDVGRVAHGVPSRVDRLRGLGNAVVPQIPELIGRAILKAEGLTP